MRLSRIFSLLALGASSASATPTPGTAASTTAAAHAQKAPTTAAALGQEANYTVTNSDCPCDRHARQFCTLFRREGVRDLTCHRISRPAVSMRVFDETIAKDNRLMCTAFEGDACDGKSAPDHSFTDNTRCGEPTRQGKKGKPWEYRSFMCHHPGW
ncbi:hypothetical protein HJFPF1_11882 [Paramyrothecium foliicola]|nr:hypothetical protein HJFPF1_11882 [Paramyrothecium foliicola]